LVVDDMRTRATRTRSTWRSFGFRVIETADDEAALRLTQHQHAALVLLELGLLKLDGREATRRTKADPARAAFACGPSPSRRVRLDAARL
jgi:CheY-like chemotaxis protein